MSGVMDWDMDQRAPALDCDHCGFDAFERENGIFYDGEGDACMTCGFPGMVSCDSENHAEWVASDDPDALCEDAACTEDCVERRGQAGCGWAFDAGMREAERDDERSRPNREASRRYEQESRHLSEMHAAVAAERERCAAWVWQASAAADENVIGDEDVAAWAIERIKSGAPAPREG